MLRLQVNLYLGFLKIDNNMKNIINNYFGGEL